MSLSFSCFMTFLVLLLLYRNNDRKLIGVLSQFRKQVLLRFFSYSQKNFSGLVGQPKKCLEPQSGEKNFLGPPRGVWGHAPPENFEN